MQNGNNGYKKESMGKDCNIMSFLLLIVVIVLGGWNYKLSGEMQNL